MSTLTVIQARAGSTRLPGKVLAPIGGRPMLGMLIERLTRADETGRVVVAVPIGDANDAVADCARDYGVAVIRGPEDDLLERFRIALGTHPAERLVRVTADNPFTDPVLFDAIVRFHADGGFDYAHAPDAPYGAAVDVFTAAAFRRCVAEGHTDYQREHINAYVLDNPDTFKTGIHAPPPELARPELRLTVDSAEDLARARAIVARLDNPVTATLAEIVAVAEVAAV